MTDLVPYTKSLKAMNNKPQIKTFVETKRDWFAFLKLSDENISYFWKQIKCASEDKLYNSKLAGNISKSILLDDPEDVAIRRIFRACKSDPKTAKKIAERTDEFAKSILVEGHKFKIFLNDIWVNYQYKYEFNPLHDHGGLFSFVVWMKIPYKLKEERNFNPVRNSGSPLSSNFVFVDSTGNSKTIELDKNFEGVACIFPSHYKHMVYPFYTSDDPRISIAGNISAKYIP